MALFFLFQKKTGEYLSFDYTFDSYFFTRYNIRTMQDTFGITIIFIFICAFVGAFISGRSKDKCLASFSKNMVTLEDKTGKAIWGVLRTENTGLELVYRDKHQDTQGHIESSYILYKNEYSSIQAVIRFHDQLDEKGKIKREKELQKTYHPSFIRRSKRRIINIFKTVRDSFVEVLNLFIGQIKKKTAAGGMLSTQDKYVNQMKQNLVGTIGTSYEPLLERYIGHKVILELMKDDKIIEYPGVLKEYTSEFMELMDIDYSVSAEEPLKKADLVVPRQSSIIRHLGE